MQNVRKSNLNVLNKTGKAHSVSTQSGLSYYTYMVLIKLAILIQITLAISLL